MATNKILPWAQTGTANVLSDDAYAADLATGGLYGDGVKTGQASSKQANKTWRQATAPGSGLGQFLVDNLSVDVTDADTPSTFSSRIANAILKLAQISPFNQSFAAAIGGYRKYAIVSDSSGNFWVSTADQNVTVPGDSGAKWQNLFDGYATQTWANSAFVQSIGVGAYKLSSATIDLGHGVPSFMDGAGGWHLVQPYGDYATNTALQAEASSRASADANLQNQINNRVQKNGDTMSGPLSINGPNNGLAINSSANAASGYNDATIYCALTNRFGYAASIGLREHVGQALEIMLSVFNGSSWYEFDLIAQGENQGRMVSPAGVSALTSDLPTSGTITGGTYTKVPLNDGSGKCLLIQSFSITGADHTNVTFPIAFSSVPTLQLTSQHNPTSDSNATSNIANYDKESLTVFGFTLDVRALWGGGGSDGQYNSVQTMVYAQGIL